MEPKARAAAERELEHVSGPTWEAGQRYVYTAEMSSRMAVGTTGSVMSFKLRSGVALELRRLDDEAIQFASMLTNPIFEAADPEKRAEFDALGRELTLPFVFTLTRGSLSEVRPQATFSRFAASITQTLAAALQFAEPPPRSTGDAWTAQEFDATGGYRAEYRRGAQPGRIEKRKLEYGPLSLGKLELGNFPAKLKPDVLSSNGTIVLETGSPGASGRAPGARLERIEYAENLRTHLTPTSPVTSETELKLTFEQQARPAAAFDWTAALSSTKATAPGQSQVGSSPTANYDATRIGDYTFEKALAELERQAKDPAANQLHGSVRGVPEDPSAVEERKARILDQSRAFTAMAALLRSEPRHVERAAARVRAQSPARRSLVDALASAGTPEAQKSLVALMDDSKVDKALRSAAAFGLGRSEDATSETVAALKNHLGESFLRIHALYGLGTICRRLREASRIERADEIAKALQQALGRAQSSADRVHALRGIANSGHPGALAAVRPFLTADSASVRAAAIDAIRLMPGPDVDAIVAEALARGEHAVQIAALDAIAVRQPSDVLAKALDVAAEYAQKPAARLKAVHIMADWSSKRPELRANLERLARHAEHAQIREAAEKALGRP